MSRTREGQKAPGYEYWSRRPCSQLGYGPDYKWMTKRSERQEERQIEHLALKGFEVRGRINGE